MITTKEDIKTDDDLNAYGWEMRILQVEEDIAVLQKRQREMLLIYHGIKEKSLSTSKKRRN